MQCPNCEANAPEGVHFCETCGTRLDALTAEASNATFPPPAPGGAPAGGACRCGAAADEVDDQGYCTACGRRRAAPRDRRDHLELALTGQFGAVTDRGHRHPRNEDAFAIALEPLEPAAYIMVVCDGVSSSIQPQVASETAANIAVKVLVEAVRAGTDPRAALEEAILTAHRTVCELPIAPVPDHDPPETTLVAALIRGGRADIGWVGDSRAYRIGSDGAHPLTRDHSWVNDQIDAGTMTEEEASKSPLAHAITQCLGVQEEGTAVEPSYTTCELTPPCTLMLCSDGLWNYAQQSDQVEVLIRNAPAGSDAVGTARHLVDFALEQGGRDNVTVAILNLPAP